MSPRAPIASQLLCLLAVALTLGASAITSPAAEPISAAMRHGQKQLQRMLDDRPGMALYRAEGSPITHYLNETDAPWQWAQKAFAGSYVGERVFWDHRLPSGELPGDFTTPYFHGLYSVALRPYAHIDPEHFEHTWARLVYEMHRMSRDTQRSRIATLVQYRWVPVDTAVQEYARIYWSVRRELEQFYHQTWRPWAESRGLPVHPRLWMLDHTGTFDTWYEEQRESFDYMRTYYEKLLRPPGK